MNKINKSVRSLLKIEESIRRKNKIQNLLNVKLQFEPYIANDLNTIFAVGTSKDMKIIKPQFNFNFAENIPFYSTSHIYNGLFDKENKDYFEIEQFIITLLENDIPYSKAIKVASTIYKVNKSQIYKKYIKLAKKLDKD